MPRIYTNQEIKDTIEKIKQLLPFGESYEVMFDIFNSVTILESVEKCKLGDLKSRYAEPEAEYDEEKGKNITPQLITLVTAECKHDLQLNCLEIYAINNGARLVCGDTVLEFRKITKEE